MQLNWNQVNFIKYFKLNATLRMEGKKKFATENITVMLTSYYQWLSLLTPILTQDKLSSKILSIYWLKRESRKLC